LSPCPVLMVFAIDTSGATPGASLPDKTPILDQSRFSSVASPESAYTRGTRVSPTKT
jgi:hypothetical protein